MIKISHTINLQKKDMLAAKAFINRMIDKGYYSEFFSKFTSDYKEITKEILLAAPDKVDGNTLKQFKKWKSDFMIKVGMFPLNVRSGELQ